MSPWLCGASSVCSVPGVAQYRVPPGAGSQGTHKSQHARAGLRESQDGAESGASYPCSCSLPSLLGFSLLSQLLPHPPLGSLPAHLCSSQRRSRLTFRTPSGLCVCVTTLVPWALWGGSLCRGLEPPQAYCLTLQPRSDQADSKDLRDSQSGCWPGCVPTGT